MKKHELLIVEVLRSLNLCAAVAPASTDEIVADGYVLIEAGYTYDLFVGHSLISCEVIDEFIAKKEYRCVIDYIRDKWYEAFEVTVAGCWKDLQSRNFDNS